MASTIDPAAYSSSASHSLSTTAPQQQQQQQQSQTSPQQQQPQQQQQQQQQQQGFSAQSSSSTSTTADPSQTNVYVRNIPLSWKQGDLSQAFTAFGTIVSSHVMLDPASGVSRGVGFVRFSSVQEAQAAIAGMNGNTPDTTTGKALLVKFADKPVANGSGTTGHSNAGQGGMHHNIAGGMGGNGGYRRGGPGARGGAVEGSMRGTYNNAITSQLQQQQQQPQQQPRISSTNIYIADLPVTTTKEEIDSLCSKFGSISSSTVLTDPRTGLGRGIALVRFNSTDSAEAAIAGLHGQITPGGQRPLQVRFAKAGVAKARALAQAAYRNATAYPNTGRLMYSQAGPGQGQQQQQQYYPYGHNTTYQASQYTQTLVPSQFAALSQTSTQQAIAPSFYTPSQTLNAAPSYTSYYNPQAQQQQQPQQQQLATTVGRK